jgi:hypothetical protein|tara:strand:- start:102 stop:578 length:477 start_codon:yes stop_codon:yes gene_type:complete
MNLSEEQKQIIAQRLSDGASISDIQRLVTDEFNGSMTFMETRFLIDDLNLDLKEPEPEPEPEPEISEEPSVAHEAEATLVDEPAAGASSVSVEIDTIKQPGTSLSGTVTFSDGVSAKWYVDPNGRLGLDPEQPDYQPNPADIEAFQIELQSRMQGPEV